MRAIKFRPRNIVAASLPRDYCANNYPTEKHMRDIKSRLRNIVAAGLPRDYCANNYQNVKHNARCKIATTQYRSSGFNPRLLCK
ncbi:hypothetical protein CXF89_19190 [Pseudoalteromonas sp. MelDa3]|nr:hypothetical protein CXF89_19190 [Pseudoalteromonas sp. MelDa3]